MVSVTVATDGCLPAALDRLYAVVAALIDPVKEMHGGAKQLGNTLGWLRPRMLPEGRVARYGDATANRRHSPGTPLSS
jgi:hypothetical protein